MRTRHLLPLLLATGPALLFTPFASAQSYWSSGHGDIGVSLEIQPHGDHNHYYLHSHWGLDSGAVVDGVALPNPPAPLAQHEFAPATLVAWSNTTQNATAPVAQALGIAAGSSVYRAGNENYQPNLGFAAYGIGSDLDWVDGGLTITLSDWSGSNPGSFALVHGASDIIASTFDPALSEAGNSFFLGAGDHDHYSWYFSSAGYYQLTFTWEGYLLGDESEPEFVTVSNTYGFHVGTAVPEPSTWALLLSATTGIGAIIVRRRKRVAPAASRLAHTNG